MNEQTLRCLACGRCPEDRVLAATKRILCKEYQHESWDELDLDANMVAKALWERDIPCNPCPKGH